MSKPALLACRRPRVQPDDDGVARATTAIAYAQNDIPSSTMYRHRHVHFEGRRDLFDVYCAVPMLILGCRILSEP